MKKVTKLIEKIEGETLAYYSSEDVIEMLKNLEFDNSNNKTNFFDVGKIKEEFASKIKEGIISKKSYYEKEREVIRRQQKSYTWTREQRVSGSEAYGRLQRKEDVFNIKIFELEYALVCVDFAIINKKN